RLVEPDRGQRALHARADPVGPARAPIRGPSSGRAGRTGLPSAGAADSSRAREDLARRSSRADLTIDVVDTRDGASLSCPRKIGARRMAKKAARKKSTSTTAASKSASKKAAPRKAAKKAAAPKKKAPPRKAASKKAAPRTA